MADDDVTFSFRVHLTVPPTQVVVPRADANEILEWAVEHNERSKQLHRRLTRALKRVVIVSEAMRGELLRILGPDAIEANHSLTPAQTELRKVAETSGIVD